MSQKHSSPDEFKGKLKDSLFWWLGKKKPFYINGDYKVELLHIDREHYSAKIRITNLKDNAVTTIDSEESYHEQQA